MLLPPISALEFFAAYVLAAAVRGLLVGAAVLAVTTWFVDLRIASPLWVLGFGMLGAGILGALGIVAGIWADKIDQLAAFQNFIILPLTFLSGVFYSIRALPSGWQAASHLNPFFYMIDGFRYGFFGVSDFPPLASLAVAGVSFAVLCGAAFAMLRSGWKLRT
jgi:ABC-2 type transport system permease protein